MAKPQPRRSPFSAASTPSRDSGVDRQRRRSAYTWRKESSRTKRRIVINRADLRALEFSAPCFFLFFSPLSLVLEQFRPVLPSPILLDDRHTYKSVRSSQVLPHRTPPSNKTLRFHPVAQTVDAFVSNPNCRPPNLPRRQSCVATPTTKGSPIASQSNGCLRHCSEHRHPPSPFPSCGCAGWSTTPVPSPWTHVVTRR